MKLKRSLPIIAAAALTLTSCGIFAENDEDIKTTRKATSVTSNRDGGLFKISDDDDPAEEEASPQKKMPAYPDLAPIPSIPDIAAGSPDDGSYPVAGGESGYYDEYGHYHYSADELYNEMYNACMEYRDVIYLDGVFEDADFQNAFNKVFLMNPDVFWVDNIRYQTFEDWTARLDFDIYDGIDLSKVYAMHEEVINKADEIAAMAKKMPTDYERIKFVHDYIIEHTEYDEKVIDTYKNYAYGCLINGKTACHGYSKAFQLVTNRMGYTSGLIRGFADSKHSWNYIWFGDDYYWLDLTWDDPIEGEYAMVNHNYFMCSDDTMLKNRTISDYNAFIPVCDHDTYEYEKMNGLYLDSYDFDMIDSLMYACKDGHIDLRFANKEAYEDAYTALYKNGDIYKTSVFSRRTNTYFSWFDDDWCISIDWWEE